MSADRGTSQRVGRLVGPAQPLSVPYAGSFGIDTLGVRVPLIPGRHISERRTQVPDVGAVWQSGDHLQVEASLPKRRNGHNLALLSAGQAQESLNTLLEALSSEYPIASVRPCHVGISRLDIACNLEALVGLDWYLEAVVREQANHRRPRLYFKDGRAATFRAGVKAWSLSAYDKYAESGLTEAVGILRVEATLRRRTLRDAKWLAGANMHTVADISDARLTRAYERTVDQLALRKEVAREAWPDVTLRINWEERRLEVTSTKGYTGS